MIEPIVPTVRTAEHQRASALRLLSQAAESDQPLQLSAEQAGAVVEHIQRLTADLADYATLIAAGLDAGGAA